jgi:hypothetical protein
MSHGKKRKLRSLGDVAEEIRVANSASDWTIAELDFFNVVFEEKNYEQMFSEEERSSQEPAWITSLRHPTCTTFLRSFSLDAMVACPQDTKLFWTKLDHVRRTPREESAVDVLLQEVFDKTLASPPHIAVYERPEWPLIVAGEKKAAKPDLYVVDQRTDNTVLVVQEDKARYNDHDEPFAQVSC